MIDESLKDKYYCLLKKHFIRPDEAYLAEAAELGRTLVSVNVPPEDIAELHEDVIRRIGEEFPDIKLLDIAHLISEPLLELFMAYGLAFRARIDNYKKVEKELRNSREHLEELIKERTEDLEKTNKQLRAAVMELDSFSYSISHDLKAPLRAISGFAGMLLEDHSDSLDNEAQQKLNVIHTNAVQMGRLIDDILKLSRMARKPLEQTEIDMQKLAESIFAGLRKEFPERTIHFNISGLPVCRGDRVLITQIMTNLLSNAIKFTRLLEVAEIEVGSAQDDNKTTYYIKDNGVGFDMKYSDKLFGLFQRLHSTKEYEGTGVGLAIVKRLVHRHSGHVWAEGKVDEGATFYFTLGTN